MQLRELDKRERIVLGAGGVALLVMVLYLVAEGPMDAYEKSKGQVIAARSNLSRAQSIAKEKQAARKDKDVIDNMIKARGPGYNLWGDINRAVQTAQLSDRATRDSMPGLTAKASAVKLGLKGVSLEELVNLLYDIQSKDSLVVLHEVRFLRLATDGEGLECELVFTTPTI